MTTPKIAVEIGSPGRGQNFLIDGEVCAIITRAIKRSGMRREEIVSAFFARFGIRITVSMLNDYSAASKKHTRFPLSFVQAFCEITGDDSLRKFAAGVRIAKAAAAFDSVAEALKDRKSKSRGK
jgi:hypothetical protein